VKEGIWKKEVGKNASAKDLGPCHRIKRRIYAKKEKGILIIEGRKRRKRRSASICRGSVKERIHTTFQVIPNITSTLCGKKGWHTKNGAGLLIHKPVDNKKWIFFTSHRRYIGWSREEKGVYEAGPEVGIQ